MQSHAVIQPGSATDERHRAAVIGGGIAGLVAARELARSGHAVTVFEAAPDFGGCVRAHRVAGLVLDAGAESFATRSTAVADLLAELGLAHDIVVPQPGGAWLYSTRGEVPMAQPLPATGILGVPGDPFAQEVRNAVGRDGALRAQTDLTTPVSAELLEGALSLGTLVRSRMGAAVLDNLVTPVVAGVHSADPDTLDVDVVAPGLRAAVRRHGSLARAVATMRASAPAGSAVAGLVGGMNRLTVALLQDLRTAAVVLRPGTRVDALQHHPGAGANAFRLHVTATATADRQTPGPPRTGSEFFSTVVIATPGDTATDLLAGIDPRFAAERPAPGADISLVTLVLHKPELDEAPRGTGLLVAPTVRSVGAKALTHGTSKWQWLAHRSGPGRHVLRLSYGRLNDAAGSLANADDATLLDAALADASTLLGLEIRAEDVLGHDVVRYAGALPFATTGHAARVTAIRDRVAATPGLEIVGAWLSGTGLAAVVADTRARLQSGAQRADTVPAATHETSPSDARPSDPRRFVRGTAEKEEGPR